MLRTSVVLCEAFRFLRGDSPKGTLDQAGLHSVMHFPSPEARHAAAAKAQSASSAAQAFVVATAGLWRVLPATLCCNVQHTVLSTRELLLWTNKEGARPFPIVFVFRINFGHICMPVYANTDTEEAQRTIQQQRECRGAILQTLEQLSDSMPHLEHLRVDLLYPQTARADPIRFVNVLPAASLRSLELEESGINEGVAQLNAAAIRALAHRVPLLEELSARITYEAARALFEEKKMLKRNADDDNDDDADNNDRNGNRSRSRSMFPRMTSLMLAVSTRPSSRLCGHLLEVAMLSALVPQLKSFEIRDVLCTDRDETELDGGEVLLLPRPNNNDSHARGEITLAPLRNCSLLGDAFLSGISSTDINSVTKGSLLSAASFFHLRACHTVGAGFLGQCSFGRNDQEGPTSRHVDLRGMCSLRHIGNCMLMSANDISSVTLPETVETIGSFFGSSSSITHLDLSHLHQLRSVQTSHFLQRATMLERFDTSPLLGCVAGGEVGSSFLSECSALVHVDLSGLRGVKEILGRFLCNADKLRVVAGMRALSAVTRISSHFMRATHSLAECDFSVLKNVTEIGDFFCEDSSPFGREGKAIVLEFQRANLTRIEEQQQQQQRS